MGYAKIVSLGSSCQVAHQMRRNFSDQIQAYPFDWIGTYNNKGINALINDGLHQLALMNNLIITNEIQSSDTHWSIKDTKYDISFLHHFPAEKLIEEEYPNFRMKLEFLCQRWADLMASGSKILFIRAMGDSLDTVIQNAPELDAILKRTYPTVEYDLLYVYFGSSALPATRIGNRLLVGRVSKGETWEGDDASWAELLLSMLDAPARARQPRHGLRWGQGPDPHAPFGAALPSSGSTGRA